MTATLDVEQEVAGCPREKVFDAFAGWGSGAARLPEGSACTWSRVGGRFWEDWGDGDGALHATVTGIRRPSSRPAAGPWACAPR